ncbi:SAM-dependent methyltransferase [Intrasporangium sp. YIM S08009]|uniref:SAM-dependent methyltransferase n=1 Tax=Intrasporangium zincisolvens TaxID=3080018 RepID=UPI002B056C92|nr:SAM-dependent methyltransferase [Intrasporangium sp. YIM S08009]
MDALPWREAWHAALYAPGRGFYVSGGGPAEHFTTATHGPPGAALARALLALPEHPVRLVVDVGAGRGELAAHLRTALDETPAGASVRVVAVDVVERPETLDGRIEWVRSPGGAALPPDLVDLVDDDGLEDCLVVAHEWLDVVPCTVAQVDASGVLRVVLVDPATGQEHLGEPLAGSDLEWAREHWPASTPGDRVEVGLDRDRAWADLVRRVRSGTLVAVDYAHTRDSRPAHGTLVGYASGHLTAPVPDGSCDVTAHVAVDTLDADETPTQREALRRLGLTATVPPHALASQDPLGYLAALERTSAEARLVDPAGFGGFRWAVKRLHARDVR